MTLFTLNSKKKLFHMGTFQRSHREPTLRVYEQQSYKHMNILTLKIASVTEPGWLMTRV